MLQQEDDNADVARLRQTLHLCWMGKELLDFLDSRSSSDAPPFVSNYNGYWRSKFSVYKQRCDKAEVQIKQIQFVPGQFPETRTKNSLNLNQLLRNLSYQEQRSSAETLLERVLGTLALDEKLLIDSPRLTRRGYRLPAKVNPLDCYRTAPDGSETQWNRSPLDRPIFGGETTCSFRLSTNFAMQTLDDLSEILGVSEVKNIQEVLSRFKGSEVPAFGIKLSATVNGVPIRLRELSGAETGNEQCDPTTHQTCIGNYGTIGPDGYFYPELVPAPGASADHGDLFQRLTTNKRTGRAVSFQNSINIIGSTIAAKCPRSYPKYSELFSEEFKHDCLFAQSDIDSTKKYIDRPDNYSVDYTISENNQFIGRNRVLEFRANPLDVVELHYKLFGIENKVSISAWGSKISNDNWKILHS